MTIILPDAVQAGVAALVVGWNTLDTPLFDSGYSFLDVLISFAAFYVVSNFILRIVDSKATTEPLGSIGSVAEPEEPSDARYYGGQQNFNPWELRRGELGEQSNLHPMENWDSITSAEAARDDIARDLEYM